MLELKETKSILKYYGFMSNNVEPIACEYENMAGLFVTLKTKYGHLSRCITFKTKKALESFLKLYMWYRSEINNPDVYVEFDNYEVINPKIKFYKATDEITEKYLKEENEIKNVETLEITTPHDENLELLNVIYTKVRCFIQEAKSLESDLIDVISNYLDKLTDYLELINNDEEVEDVEIDAFDGKEYEDKINKILTNFKKDKDDNIEFYLNTAVSIYTESLLDEVYDNDLYYLEFYKEESRKIDELIKLFDEYNKEKAKNPRVLKKQKIRSYEDYVMANFTDTNVSKNEILEKRHKEVNKILAEFKNNDIVDLKLKYHIIDVDDEIDLDDQEVLDLNTINVNDIKKYFKNLTAKEKTINVILSSPLKELINHIISLESKDIYEEILKDSRYYKKFNELYEILSNEDNFAICRKYLKPIGLDSIEEFIKSLIKVVNNIHYNTFELDKKTVLKYKIGVLLDNGYMNVSILDNYPINSKGLNNYYISETKIKVPIYYANKILYLDEDNILKVKNNDDVVTIDMKDLKVSNKKKISVKDYTFKNNNKKEFKIFNEKTYTLSDIQGDA